MPVYLLNTPNYHPWDATLRCLQSNVDGGKKKFKEIQDVGASRAGLIIGGWNTEGELKWWYSIGDSDPWESFEDDRIAQTPFMYKTLKSAIKRIDSLKESIVEEKFLNLPVAHVGLVYWVHPDAYDAPLDDYVKMTEGIRLPGCARN